MANDIFMSRNRKEYSDRYPLLNFPTPHQALSAEERRDEILAAVGASAGIGCGGSKIGSKGLSPGCALCVAGRWSCLFINGQCNARCFYCPSAQDEVGEPTTNAVNFRSPRDYADYIGAFGFTGVSFSGGEPLLTPERTLNYLAAVKKRFGGEVHTWLYTNGTLVDADLLGRLRDAGLDEVRFDIGATGYRLDKAALAVGIIPTVTVEIPAVPEDKELMREKIAEMADCGIAHLNLHQLRLTPFNFDRFQGRGYTFLHGERVTVLESELTALELIRETIDQGNGLPINYCSFVYKNRYQRQAARRRNASFVCKGWEDLTPAGFMRCLTLHGAAADLLREGQKLQEMGVAAEDFCLSRAKDRLSLRAEFLPLVDRSKYILAVTYFEAGQLTAVTYRHPFVEVAVNPGKKIFIERRQALREVRFPAQVAQSWWCADQLNGFSGPEELRGFELLPEGLSSYF